MHQPAFARTRDSGASHSPADGSAEYGAIAYFIVRGASTARCPVLGGSIARNRIAGMTQLHIESLGHGPDLVLLHGWAMHSGIWSGVQDQLARQFRLHLVDLPGMG